MKQLRTKLTAALAVLALVLSLTPAALAVGGVTAKAGNIDLTLNGTAMKLGTYNIANNNYVKLRDVAQLLKGTGKEFSVAWNGSAQRIDLASGQSYQPAGGELAPLAAGNQTAVPNSASVWLNGSAVSLTAYTINGNNFFKLRDLGSALDFFVGWDAATGVVNVDTTKSYVPETPAVDTSAMAQAMLNALNAEMAEYGYDARLADVDGDGTLELVTLGGYAKLYDWKDGALQSREIGAVVGGWCEWYLVWNTATGERGIEWRCEGGGDFSGGTSTFYYPTRELSILDHSYAVYDENTGEYLDVPPRETYRIGEAEVTQAEWQAARDQNQRLELLMDDMGSEENVAAVRAQLNGML